MLDKPTKVLIVEDDRAVREGLWLFLEGCGYDVRTAANIRAAERCIEDWPPDVAVCDWQLDAVADGVDVAEMVQEKWGTAVVLVTAYDLYELKRRTRPAAVEISSYLRKPVSLDMLLSKIASAVQDRPAAAD